jgi:hypothetical protein
MVVVTPDLTQPLLCLQALLSFSEERRRQVHPKMHVSSIQLPEYGDRGHQSAPDQHNRVIISLAHLRSFELDKLLPDGGTS